MVANCVSILLFGKSGAGKSTIINALLKDEIVKTGDGLKGVTTVCNTVTNSLRKYYITDTIGIGETEFGSIPHEHAVKHLEDFIATLTFPIDHVCFVKEAGTFDAIDNAYWKIFSKMFENCISNFVMIITKARSNWARDNQKTITSITGDIPIIDVSFPSKSNNPAKEELLFQERTESLQRLETFLEQIRNRSSHIPIVPNVSKNSRSIANSILSTLENISRMGTSTNDKERKGFIGKIFNRGTNESNPIQKIKDICTNEMLPKKEYIEQGTQIISLIESFGYS